ncbi:hypothetical protein PspLS_10163 [Pyricularia sp. CBS 133598]|nr:hypothetical protein PspLS_10163 [Pyricularia sp. CBS 133598]
MWSAVCGDKKGDDIRKKFSAFAEELELLQIQLGLFSLFLNQELRLRCSSKRIQAQIVELHRCQKRHHVEAIASSNRTEEEECLMALFRADREVTDPRDDRASLLTKKGQIVEGTCDWIFNKPEFVDWKSRQGILWISGGPGLGKTMISIHLTGHIESMSLSDPEPSQPSQPCTTIFFFCDSGQRSSGISLIKGLIIQLVKANRTLYRHILPDFKGRGTRIFEPNQDSLETLWRMFTAMLNDNCLGKVFASWMASTNAIEWLENLTSKMPNTAPHLGLIVISREYPTCLLYSLGSLPRIRLDPDSKEETNAGLELYIASRMRELADTSRGRFLPGLLQKVERTIRKKCNGTYLCIGFAIKKLQTKETSEVEDVLRGIPKGLDDMYARILNQIAEDRLNVAERLLRWYYKEMTEFLLRNGADSNAGFPPTICLVVQHTWNPRDNKIEKIRLLLNYGADVRKRGVDKRNALHEAVLCGQFDVFEVLARAPHGLEAARAVDVCGDTVFLIATRLMEKDYYNPAAGGAEEEKQAENRENLRQLLAPDMGISDLLGRSNKRGENILHVASFMGKAEFELFLGAWEGSYVTACDDDGDTPLHRAAFAWNAGVIEALLNTGRVVNVNCFNISGKTPLHLLATSRYGDARRGIDALESRIRNSLRALLQSGADLAARDRKTGKTAGQMLAERAERLNLITNPYRYPQSRPSFESLFVPWLQMAFEEIVLELRA